MSHSPLSVEKVVLNLNLSQILLFSYSPYTVHWPALLKGLLAYKYSCNSLRYKDFLYILCFLLPTAQPFLSSPMFGRSGLFWQVFSPWAGDNLTHVPGFSFKTFLFQATASWLPNPKAFFSRCQKRLIQSTSFIYLMPSIAWRTSSSIWRSLK